MPASVHIPTRASAPAISDTRPHTGMAAHLQWVPGGARVGWEHSALVPKGRPDLAAVWMQLVLELPHGAAALPLLAVLAQTVPLYLQVPHGARGEIPPATSQQEKSSCQTRALVTFWLLHEAP